ncbi:MAG: hypothetical protein AABW91_03945 [Nanoarchaeota archaeon]
MKGVKLNAIIAIVILLAGIIGFVYYISPQIFGRVIDSVVYDGTNDKVTTETFPEYLEKNSLTRDLPKDASVLVRIYSNEKSYKYYITGRSVEFIEDQQNKKSDIEVGFPLEYLSQLNGVNMCDVAKEIHGQEDLSFKINIDKISLFWKYMGVLKYRNCLGY